LNCDLYLFTALFFRHHLFETGVLCDNIGLFMLL